MFLLIKIQGFGQPVVFIITPDSCFKCLIRFWLYYAVQQRPHEVTTLHYMRNSEAGPSVVGVTVQIHHTGLSRSLSLFKGSFKCAQVENERTAFKAHMSTFGRPMTS